MRETAATGVAATVRQQSFTRGTTGGTMSYVR
jgi:hypothetical protein